MRLIDGIAECAHALIPSNPGEVRQGLTDVLSMYSCTPDVAGRQRFARYHGDRHRSLTSTYLIPNAQLSDNSRTDGWGADMSNEKPGPLVCDS